MPATNLEHDLVPEKSRMFYPFSWQRTAGGGFLPLLSAAAAEILIGLYTWRERSCYEATLMEKVAGCAINLKPTTTTDFPGRKQVGRRVWRLVWLGCRLVSFRARFVIVFYRLKLVHTYTHLWLVQHGR